VSGPLPVTHHGKTEITNAICLIAFGGELSAESVSTVLHELDGDFRDGTLVHAELLWRAALNRAADLSKLYTPAIGTRASDVLHVACALELQLPHFLTFDVRQRDLAGKAGLKTIRL